MIIPPEDIGNPDVPDNLGKYSLPIDTPSGPGEVHYYADPTTGEPNYDLDYKVKW
jgi:hypothetical protein